MKKKILLVIFILLITCACSSVKNINVKKLKELMKNKETFVLYLYDNDEGKVLNKTLSKVSDKNNIKSYSINTISLNEKDLSELKTIFKYDKTNIIIFVKDGNEETVLSRLDDLYISEKKLEQELKNQGYIK